MKSQEPEWHKLQRISEKKVNEIFHGIKQKSGVYVYIRIDEYGTRYAYVGQAVNMLQRIAQHDYKHELHIENSIHAHGYFDSVENPYGWHLYITYYPESSLDAVEKAEIEKYSRTHHIFNITAGGQGVGKTYLQSPKPSKGYRDGLAQGRKNTIKEFKHYASRLTIQPSGDGKLAARAYEKLMAMLKEIDND